MGKPSSKTTPKTTNNKFWKFCNLADSQKAELFLDESGVVLETILPAGSTLNVNPSLLVEAFCLYTKLPVEARITRENVLDQNLKSFR